MKIFKLNIFSNYIDLMDFDFNVFEEYEENPFMRFSSILLFIYIYYSLSYYFLTEKVINKPHIFFIILLLFLHLIHVIVLKFLYINDLHIYAWIFAMAPLVIFLLYSKYKDIVKRKEAKKEQMMMAKLKKQMQIPDDQPFMRNANPQMPSKPQMAQYPQQHPNQQQIMPQQQPRQIQQTQQMNYNQVLEQIHGNSRNMQNLQQNSQIRTSMSNFQDSNQVSERIEMNNGFNLSGNDPYFNMSGSF